MLCLRFFRCVEISDLAHSKENGAGHEEPVMQVRFMMDSHAGMFHAGMLTQILLRPRRGKNVQPLSIPNAQGFTQTISPPFNASLH